jgi:hypothetical protein
MNIILPGGHLLQPERVSEERRRMIVVIHGQDDS